MGTNLKLYHMVELQFPQMNFGGNAIHSIANAKIFYIKLFNIKLATFWDLNIKCSHSFGSVARFCLYFKVIMIEHTLPFLLKYEY